MEELINISKILKEQCVPAGTRFYSTALGYLYLQKIDNIDDIYFYYQDSTDDGIKDTEAGNLDRYGRLAEDGECILFPSKEQRDWTKYKYEQSYPLATKNKRFRLDPFTFSRLCDVCAEVLNVMWRSGIDDKVKINTPYMEVTFKKRD